MYHHLLELAVRQLGLCRDEQIAGLKNPIHAFLPRSSNFACPGLLRHGDHPLLNTTTTAPTTARGGAMIFKGWSRLDLVAGCWTLALKGAGL
jgi:hypothetical protein